jgi:hypothetical protein
MEIGDFIEMRVLDGSSDSTFDYITLAVKRGILGVMLIC